MLRKWVSRKHFISILIALIIISVGYFLVSYFGFVEPKWTNTIGNDWGEINVENKGAIEQIRILNENDWYGLLTPSNLTGGGIVAGQSQTIQSRMFWETQSEIYGGSTVNLSNFYFTIFDISDYQHDLIYHPENDLFSIKLSNIDKSGKVQYKELFAPFSDANNFLGSLQSLNANGINSIELKLDKSVSSMGLSYFSFISSEPFFWFWNLRNQCQVKLLRHTDTISQEKNLIEIKDDCRQSKNPFPKPNSHTDGTVSISFYPDSSAIFIVSGYSFGTEIKGIEPTGKYLIILKNFNNISRIDLLPPGPIMDLEFALQPNKNYKTIPTLLIQPAGRKIGISDLSGKVIIGNSTVQDVTYSDVEFIFSEQPVLRVRESISNVENNINYKYPLNIKGLAQSYEINQEQQVSSRWYSIPSDIRSSVIGAIVGGISTIIGWAITNLFKTGAITWNKDVRQKKITSNKKGRNL